MMRGGEGMRMERGKRSMDREKGIHEVREKGGHVKGGNGMRMGMEL